MALPLELTKGEVDTVTVPMMPLHRLLACCYEHHRNAFVQRFVGLDDAIVNFWRGVEPEDPKLLAWAPFLAQKLNYRTHCIPLALHGDGVPVFKGKSLYVISGLSLLGTGTSIDVKMILTCYWSHFKNKDQHNLDLDTEDTVWKYIQWDLEVCFSGVHPSTDALGNPWALGSAERILQGTPLAEGYFAVPWIVKGDLEYYANVLGLEHWARGDRPCMACKVDRGPCPWTDHKLVGDPRLQWTELEWRAAHPNVHRIFSIMGMSLWSLQYDIMHCVSLGVAQHIAGNVLYEMIYVIMDKGTKVDTRIAEIWSLVQEAYRLDNATTRLGTLTKSMFVDKDAPHKHYPMLKSKAKETEWFCRALAYVWPQFCDQANPVHRHTSRTLRLVLDLYDLAGTHTGLFHLPEDRELMVETAVHLLAHYNWLAKWAEEQGQKRWNTVLKHHYVGHLALQTQWLHCRAGATYLDEDYMGRIKHVAQKASGGGLVHTTSIVLQKWRRGTWLRWEALQP